MTDISIYSPSIKQNRSIFPSIIQSFMVQLHSKDVSVDELILLWNKVIFYKFYETKTLDIHPIIADWAYSRGCKPFKL